MISSKNSSSGVAGFDLGGGGVGSVAFITGLGDVVLGVVVGETVLGWVGDVVAVVGLVALGATFSVIVVFGVVPVVIDDVPLPVLAGVVFGDFVVGSNFF